jgi:hypothetical protein
VFVEKLVGDGHWLITKVCKLRTQKSFISLAPECSIAAAVVVCVEQVLLDRHRDGLAGEESGGGG